MPPTSKPCVFVATSPGNGAIPAQMREIGRQLTERGCRVVTLLDSGSKDASDHDRDVYVWPSVRPTRLRDALFLRRLIKRYRPGCFIANFGSVNVMVIVGWLMRVPKRIAWFHTLSSQIDLDRSGSFLITRLKRLRKRLVYRAATVLVANSNAARTDLIRTFGVEDDKIRVWHYAIADPPSGHADPYTSPLERGYQGAYIVCPGRLHLSKGQDVLLRAVKLIRGEFASLRVEFIGTGPERDSLVRLSKDLGVSDVCSFPGALERDRLLERMRSSSICVVPSRAEAFGLVVLEAMACGAPIVASATGGITELICNDSVGRLFEPGDAVQLAALLRELLSDETVRARMGAAARRRFEKEFELTKATDKRVHWILDAATPGGEQLSKMGGKARRSE